MGNTIRFIFKTKFRYSKFDQFLILLGIAGVIEWFYVLIFVICQQQ